MKNLARGAIVAAAAMLAGCSTARTVETVSGGEVALVRPKALELKNNMRRLWTDHVAWTRGYIVAAVANDSSASAQASRLMRNQEDIGNAVATYYGSAAGEKLTDLLKQHINIAVDLVTAAKAGDNAKVSDADRRWHDNARDIAAFLAGANPNWSRDALVNMLNEHLSLTTEEALARIQKRWTDDTVAFDRILTQALMMADALTDGIVKQFPSKV